MSLSFRRFSSTTDLRSQRELFALCFPENHGTSIESVEHYQWKFQGFPLSPAPSYEYCALDEEQRLVGYYAALPFEYRFNLTTLRSGMVCDVMTHPDMRGKGVFARLGDYSTRELAQEGCDFTIGYPIRPEVIPGHLKVGWQKRFSLPLYLRVLRTNALLRKFGFGVFGPLANLLLAFVNGVLGLFSMRGNGQYSCDVLSRDEFAKISDYPALFDDWASQVPLHLQKTRDFVLWRTGAPGTEYKFLRMVHGNRTVALAIIRHTVLADVPVLALLDLMVRRDSYDCLGLLHRELDRLAMKLNCEAIACMMGPVWRSTYGLLRAGYLRSHLTFTLIAKRLSDRVSDDTLSNERNWHLMWIDSDDL